MIVDNLTKFNQRKKLWMTPKHPLYMKPKEFKLMYGAVCLMQAELNNAMGALENPELIRLLTAGFRLGNEDISQILRISKDKKAVMEYMGENLESERERYLLILDIINVSCGEKAIEERSQESVQLIAKQFHVSREALLFLEQFLESANEDDVLQCREILHRMHLHKMELSPVDMKYYVMHFWGTMECDQALLEQKGEVRIIERCLILEDLVVKRGTRLVFDHAEVRISGNILLDGGELVIEESKVIRKGDSHRACVNMKSPHSSIVVINSEIDCRNMGMFIRAETGTLKMSGSLVYQTTRGAAIRFWGHSVQVEDCIFSECYSPEDGGAMMIRTPSGIVRRCRFRRCEAKRGGAILAVEGNEITECQFEDCCVAEFGAAVFYHGLVRANVHHLAYKDCCPEGVETVQYLSKMGTFQVTGEYYIGVSTIIDCPVMVEAEGELVIEDANVYINYPIYNRGSLKMKNVKVICNHLEKGDMIILEHSRNCRIHHCEFNGMQRAGGIYASGCRITVSNSLFRNISGGRAIYDTYSPEIRECIFNFCQDGAIYCQNGEIRRSVFVNCRAKSGAGIQMYGSRGVIEQNNFRRCIADFTGGAVDRSLGQQVIKCVFEECKPNNVS